MTVSNKSFAGMEAEFAPGVIRGVRAWQLSLAGLLHGLTYPIPWEPGLNVAVCARSNSMMPIYSLFVAFPTFPPHSSPMPECTCGFYAYFGDRVPGDTGPSVTHVLGVIEAFGRVLIGDLGFRAEKARIVALYSPIGVKLSRYPNIPVFDDYDKMIAEFPPDRSDSVAPTPPVVISTGSADGIEPPERES